MLAKYGRTTTLILYRLLLIISNLIRKLTFFGDFDYVDEKGNLLKKKKSVWIFGVNGLILWMLYSKLFDIY